MIGVVYKRIARQRRLSRAGAKNNPHRLGVLNRLPTEFLDDPGSPEENDRWHQYGLSHYR
jgi:hypothetical protein